MIIDSGSLKEDEWLQADICIVGAGVAGMTIASEFLDNGKKVILLESGGKKPAPETSALNEGKNIGQPYYDLIQTRERAIGGTSHLWCVDIKSEIEGIRLRALDEIDFEKKEWAPGSGWPFSKKEIDPYYKKAHRLMEMGPFDYRPEEWIVNNENTPYLNTKHLKTTFFQFAKKNIFYDHLQSRFEPNRNVSIYYNATVLKINTTGDEKKVNSLRVSTFNHKKFFVEADLFILAMGGLENPRLLMLSDDTHKSGLGNRFDHVGRYFMEHPHMWKNVARFYPHKPEKFNKNRCYSLHHVKGTPVKGYIKLSDEMIRQHKLISFTLSFREKSKMKTKGMMEVSQALRLAKKQLTGRFRFEELKQVCTVLACKSHVLAYEAARRMTGGELKSWDRLGHEYDGINVNFMSEQFANADSRVLLGNTTDRFGCRKIELDWKISEKDMAHIVKSLELMDQELRREKLGYLDIIISGTKPPQEITGGYHHMGTTRMSSKPEDGVVDENCKLYGTENLYIAGSSVFPSSGYANPTLTIIALSFRLAEHLKTVLDQEKVLN